MIARKGLDAAVLGACAVLGLMLVADSARAAVPARLWTERSTATPISADAPVSMGTFSRLSRELSPSVLNISVVGRGRQRIIPGYPFAPPRGRGGQSSSLGSGFIIHKDGYALTNNHVIDGATSIEVKLHNDHVYAARVVGTYPRLDVALLKFEPKEPLTVAALGQSEAMQIGEWVIAIGNPFGLNHTVTAGIISAMGRHDVPIGDSEPMYANFIQTDASINPGSSGGPLINARGEVVGIVTAINPQAQGIAFAIPIDMIKTVLPQLAAGHVARSYMGVRIGPVSAALANTLGMDRPDGAVIREVFQGQPAAQAGLAPGDIITRWDGQEIKHWEDVSWLASTAGVERAIEVEIRRGKDTHKVNLHLANYPDDARAQAQAQAPAPVEQTPPPGAVLGAVGMRIDELPAKSRQGLRLHKGAGAVVVAVDRGSAAQLAGIEVGDVILQVNYESIVGGVNDVKAKVQSVGKGEVLSFLLRRGDRQIFLAFSR